MLQLHELVQLYKKDVTAKKISEPLAVLEAKGKRIFENHIKILELIDQSIDTVETSITNIQSSIDNNVTDYDWQIIGVKDGVNKIFQLTYPYQPNSTKVWLDGIRLTPHANYDFVESGNNIITFNYPLNYNNTLLVEYKKQIITT